MEKFFDALILFGYVTILIGHLGLLIQGSDGPTPPTGAAPVAPIAPPASDEPPTAAKPASYLVKV